MRNTCINNALFGRFWKPFPVSCSAIGFVIRIELVYIQLQCETQIYSRIEPVQTMEIMCIIKKNRSGATANFFHFNSSCAPSCCCRCTARLPGPSRLIPLCIDQEFVKSLWKQKDSFVDLGRASDIHQAQLLAAAIRKQQAYQPLVDGLSYSVTTPSKDGWCMSSRW